MIFERPTGHDHVLDAWIHLVVAAVRDDQLVVRVEEGKAFRDRLDGGRNRPALAFRLRFKPRALGDAVAKQRKRLRHRADLVAARLAEYRRRNARRSSPTSPCSAGCSGVTIERKTSERQRDADEHDRADDATVSVRMALDAAGQRRVARGPRLVVQILRSAAASRSSTALLCSRACGEERVADDPVIVGIGIHRLERLRHIGVGLARDVRGEPADPRPASWSR